MRQKVFLAHSHHDQNIAYALSEWILNLWSDLSVFLTHNGLSELDRLVPYYYLHAIPGSDAFICLISRNCFASNAIFDELEVAAKASCNIILVIQPNMRYARERVGVVSGLERAISRRDSYRSAGASAGKVSPGARRFVARRW